MPHALTPRQREYLEFLREYIRENESSPRLEEIAEHFGVKSPTAHKTLSALHEKGYIYFARSSVSGFFIRLIERAGSAETLIEVAVSGEVNRYGELINFPKMHRHFASVVPGANPEDVFALALAEDIPEANMVFGDWLICDRNKRPQPGDIAILPFSRSGRRFLLCHIDSLTYDKDLVSEEASNDYPIPEDLLDTSREQLFNWSPLAFSEETKEYYWQELEKEGWPTSPMPPELVMGTVLRLIRHLAL